MGVSNKTNNTLRKWPQIQSPERLFERVTYYLWKRDGQACNTCVKLLCETKPDKRWLEGQRSSVLTINSIPWPMDMNTLKFDLLHILRRCAPGKLNHFKNINWIPPNWDLCTQKELRITKSVSVYITIVKPFEFWGAILLNLSPSKVSCASIHTAYFTYTNLPSHCFHF